MPDIVRQAPPRLRFALAPAASRLLRARDRIRDYLTLHCSDQKIIDDVVLAIEEACTNAIRHSGSPEEIEICLGFHCHDLLAVVKDQGQGFDVNAFDPDVLPDVLRDHGRGLFLISRLTDEVELCRDGGLEVRMVKKGVWRRQATALESGLGDIGTVPQLVHREARLRAMLEEIDEAFAAFDWEYRCVHVNEAAVHLSRKPIPELLGRQPWDVWPTFGDTPALAAMRDAMELGRPSVVEFRAEALGAWLEMRVYPTSAGISAYFREISERKRVEEALRESEERFRSLFESTIEGVALHEVIYQGDRAVDYRILDVNLSYERQTGLMAAQARGRLASELYGIGCAPYLAEYARVAGSAEPYHFETYFEPMERHFRITAVSVGQGRFATIFEDITGRKRIEAERQRLLEESQAQAEELQAQSEELQAQTEELRAQTEDLFRRGSLAEALNAINRIVHSSLDFDEILQRALDEGVRALAVDAGTIEMRDDSCWMVRYQHGFADADVGLCLTDAEAPNATRVEQSREPLTIADMRGDVTADVGFVHRYGLRSVLAVPLTTHELVIGCLLFYGETHRSFDEPEIDFGRKLGATVSLAIENGRLFDAEVEAERHVRLELERANLLLEAATTAASWTDLGQMLESLADLLVRSTNHSRVVLELWDEELQEVEIAVSRGSLTLPRQRFRFDDISDAAKEVIRTRKMVVIDYAKAGLPGPLRAYLEEHAFRLLLATPILYRDRLVGLIMVDHPGERRPFAPREIQLIEAVAGQAGVAIENARLFAAEREAREAEAARASQLDLILQSAKLLAGGLELQPVLDALVDFVLEALPHSRVTVHLWDAVGRSLTTAVSQGCRPAPRGTRIPFDQSSAAFRDMLTRRAVEVTDLEALPPAARGRLGEFASVLHLGVPLVAGTEFVGVLVVDDPGERRPFSEREIALLEAIAAQAATAIQNARLFEAQRDIATTMQQNFIHPLPPIEGLDLAALSLPAGRQELVGGDFHDVFQLPDGLVVAVIGDVMGKGVRAAGLTETVRSAVRALAFVSPAPDYILANVNRLLLHEEERQQLVTVLLVLLDPESGQGFLVSAGHPSAVLLSADTCRIVQPHYGLPLGAIDQSFVSRDFCLAPGEALVLYTDGVTEARRDGEFFGEKRLLKILGMAQDKKPQHLIERVQNAVIAYAGELGDDLEILALRRTE